MDPLAHTLLGASLAATRLRDSTPLATPALILGANAPDIDAITMLLDRDVSLWFRRGWTHGVLAMVVLPVALTVLLLLLDRIVARVRGRRPGARAGPLLAVCSLAVISHPLLDWLNTYGVRFLMPFDGTWFYGDSLFIVDPWIWLLLGTAAVLAFSTSTASAAVWVLLGAMTTFLVSGADAAPLATRWLWCIGVAAIVGLRLHGSWCREVSRLANACLAATILYIAAMVGASELAVRQTAGWLAERQLVAEEIMANPAPGNPFRREILVADGTHYHFLEVNWLRSRTIRATHPSIERGPDGPVTQAALAAPHVRGLAAWKRFPAYRVEEGENGYSVSIYDVRYTRRVGSRFGSAVVELDRDLQVRSP